MLHVLLIILKTIGILLLVLLAILVLLILAVLFIPFRYRVCIRKEEGPPEASARLTWLLHLLCADICWKDKQGSAKLRLLGFNLKTFRFPDRGKKEPSPAEEDNTSDASTAKNNASEAGAAEGQDNTHAAEPPEDLSAPENPEDPLPADGSWKGPGSQEKAFDSRLPGRTVRLFEKLLDFLLSLANLPLAVYDRAWSAEERACRKLEDLTKKVRPILSVEGEHIIRKLWKELLYLLDGWKVRRAQGYLSYGTGKPDQTGMLAGLITLLLPADHKDYRVEPDFYEKKLRTDTVLAGSIRLYRLAAAGVAILTDREFWRLLRMIRGKDVSHRKKARRKKHI